MSGVKEKRVCEEHHTIPYSTIPVRSLVSVLAQYNDGQRAGLRRKIHKAVAGNNSTVSVRYTVYCQ